MRAEGSVLSIDVGSVAIGMAVVADDRTVMHTGYCFHKGEIRSALVKLLAEVDVSTIRYVAATASTPEEIQASGRYSNEVSYIAAARAFHRDMRALLVVGGEKFSLSRFDHDGHYLGSRANTSCAAGTGSFLDQQANRLGMKGIKNLSQVASECRGDCPQIASRCAVFAKTDLIHAQQEGYRLEEISAGLCQGLAKNLVDTLFVDGSIPGGEVIFCGGVAKNEAVAQYIGELTGNELERPESGHLYGAIGAAYQLLDELAEATVGPPSANLSIPSDIWQSRPAETVANHYPPLALQYSEYPDFDSAEHYLSHKDGEAPVEVDIYRPVQREEQIDVFLGIDIGSTSTKAVLVTGDREVVAGFYTRTAGRPLAAVQAIFRCVEEISNRYEMTFHVVQCGTTGSGRKFVGKVIGADAMLDEITAHARAACQLNPEVDTIIEIGGQDAKFTTLQDGRVTSSTMNTVCAAGTGSFIEEQALKLGCSVDEYSARAENIRAPMVSDRCTVFMERDMSHYLSEGYSVNEVLASALHAVRENYLLKVATENSIGQTILFQGATAKNKALVAAFEQRLERPILVSRFCHLTGALGTALTMQDERIQRKSTFVGFDLHRKEIPLSSEVCNLCNNNCKISIAEVNSTRVAYGFLCGRDYDTRNYVKVATGAFDLVRERRRVSRVPESAVLDGPVIGLPAAVHMVEDLPMWRYFFQLLGVRTITSEQCADGLKVGKKLSRAEFCAPMTAMHGHADWLLQRADYLFLPTYLEEKAKDVRRQYCYYTQFLPSLVAALGHDQGKVLRPVLKYLYTSFHAKIQLYRMLQDITPGRVSFLEVAQAFDKALRFKDECRTRNKELFLQRELAQGEIAVVLLGRPYTVLSPGLNANIPGIFQKLGIDAYYQDMLDYTDEDIKEVQPLLDELHWEHAVRIIEAAEVVASRPGVYPVFLTSFMCTPDAFTLEYFKSLMARHNKPYLVLQLDEHDSSVGYETRIEAAIRSFKNHQLQQKQQPLPVNYTTVNPRLESRLDRKYVVFPNWDNITCSLLSSTLRREGYDVLLMNETNQTIRASIKHNSGQCIPLNAVAQGYMETIRSRELAPEECVLWLNYSTLACNIRMYPHHIKHILETNGLGEAGVYVGQLSLAEISLRATMNAYFAYMLGGMLRKVACAIRPYEVIQGETDRVLQKSVQILAGAFEGRQDKEDALKEIVSHFEWIETKKTARPKVAVFGDLYVRDNRVMNQNLVRFIEANGGEVITTPYSEYAKMIAPAYFRKWFNEGKYLDVLTNRALLATMQQLEKTYTRILGRVLTEPEHVYDDNPADILSAFDISIENTGESMDNILKIHYVKKYHPDVSLFVQTSPALCCPSLITEAMRDRIEEKTGVPVVSVTYDGTGGAKNEIILPYLKYPRTVVSGDTQKKQANEA